MPGNTHTHIIIVTIPSVPLSTPLSVSLLHLIVCLFFPYLPILLVCVCVCVFCRQRDYGGPLVCQDGESRVIVGVSVDRKSTRLNSSH